jgi:hypothetical protein
MAQHQLGILPLTRIHGEERDKANVRRMQKNVGKESER